MDNFDQNQYSLYPVHLRLDRLGFVWVNLESANPPSIPWEDHFDGVDKRPRQKDFSMDDFAFDHAWELEGEYNWKAMVDNYNEVGENFLEQRALTLMVLVLSLYNRTPWDPGHHEVGHLRCQGHQGFH